MTIICLCASEVLSRIIQRIYCRQKTPAIICTRSNNRLHILAAADTSTGSLLANKEILKHNIDMILPVSKEKRQKKAFIAAPFSSRFNPSIGITDDALKRTLKSIILRVKMKGYGVESSHVREDWGKKVMHPSKFVPLDYQSIEECDFFLAYIDDCHPTGLYIELGWASMLRKKILILLKDGVPYSPMLDGLSNIKKSNTKIFKFNDSERLLHNLNKVLDTAL